MLLKANEKLVTILERTLNLVDYRLVDHGKRVAYLVYKKLYPLALYNNRELRDICMLALLHDVGAYKTDDVSDIVHFDTQNIWSHSIYGYLFLKYFSPLKELAPVVLFHHALPDRLDGLSSEQKKLALLLNECDREDIRINIREKNYASSPSTDKEFEDLFRSAEFTKDDMESYIKMIVFCIDFRSPQTLLHTFAASFVAESLAVLAGFNADETEKIRTSAMLHDIGKMGTPLHILESTSTELTPHDMEIMRRHVVHSAEVLKGCVCDYVYNTAVNHHERLNGKGYPRRLGENEIAPSDRLMAVADLFSAMCVSRSYQKAKPKDKAIHILESMKTYNLLDSGYIDLAIKHYDEISDALRIKSEPVIKLYDDIKREFFWLNNKFSQGKFDYVYAGEL